MSEYQDRIVARRKEAANRSRQRHHRSRGDLERSLTRCAFCDRPYHAALGNCDCAESRQARRQMRGDAA